MRKYIIIILGMLFSINATAQNALKFDGVDDYVQSPNPGPTGASSRTVEAWVNLGVLSSTQMVILDWGDMATGNRFTLNIINGIPRIEVGNFGVSAPSAISINTWHHIAGTYDNSANILRLYVDGVLKNSGTPTVAINTSNVNGIIIGRRNDAINNFSGIIDEVRVWNTARTQTEISSNMNKEFCSPVAGLVDYYKFNQGVASGNNTGLNSLLELSGNANNGVLYNFSLTGSTSNWVTGKTLTSNSTSSINIFACNSYTTPSGLYTYNSTGVYHDTIPNSGGCDSIITINLTVTIVDTAVTQIGNTLTANAAGATYQWLDCNNAFAPVSGAVLQSYTPTVNGSYALKITKNGCTDTSSCHLVNSVSIYEMNLIKNVSVYPNPFSGTTTIHFSTAKPGLNYDVKVLDVQGCIVLESRNISQQNFILDINQQTAGIYILEITSAGSILREKLIKQ